MKIRDARDDDHAEIARVAHESDLLLDELTTASFPGMLAWLYANPPSRIRLQFVAEHDDAVVAHYGAVPFAYKLLDERCVAGFASNLVIDRAHRAGMLFLSLQSYLQREYRKKNFRFVYGLITRPSVLEPHLRMGWKKLGTVPVYAKPFDFPAVAASYLKHRAVRALAYAPLKAAEAVWRAGFSRNPKDVAIEEVPAFGADADGFLGRVHGAPRDHRGARPRDAQLALRELCRTARTGFLSRAGAGAVVGYVVTRRMKLKHLRRWRWRTSRSTRRTAPPARRCCGAATAKRHAAASTSRRRS